MAEKTLTSNVHVDGKWYGPDHPRNQVTADVLAKVTNPAAFEAPTVGAPDNRFRHDDFGEVAPNLRAGEATGAAPTASRDEYSAMSKAELIAASEARGIEVSSSDTKDDLIDRLVGG